MSLIRRWVLGAGMLVLLLALGRQSRLLINGLEILTVLGVGWLMARHDGGKIEGLAAGSFSGLVLGFAVSVGRCIAVPTLTNGLYILVETAVTAIVAAFLCVSGVLIFHLFRTVHH